MSATTDTHESLVPDGEHDRWPAMASVRPAPVRAELAEWFLRRVVVQAGIRVEMPDGTGFGPSSGPLLVVRNAGSFFTRLGRDGKVGFGEAYMAKDWESPELAAVLEAMARNVTSLVPARLQHLRRFFEARHPIDEDNDRRGAKRNITRHYDLSNELFALFLDQSMSYSSALFEHPEESLEEGQARKVSRILDISGVGPGSRVLEIGTGWGELALQAARRGATVTSVTLSQEQAAYARRKVDEAEFGGMVDIRTQDYRDVTGQYDAIVSVEMIEAVGERWWPTFFQKIDSLLALNGKVGLQAILMEHDRLLATRSSWTWIHKYIFPGGIIPSRQAIDEVLTHHTTLRVIDALSFGSSYADTLLQWRDAFAAQKSAVAALGFDETFRRMWNFYLAYSEAGFRSGYLDVTQLALGRTTSSSPREAQTAGQLS
jgi:cyclopropane-fatty-acyl-phospholipid synthase